MKRTLFLFMILVSPILTFAQAQQWRGDHRDGNYSVNNLKDKWPESGPTLVWAIDTGLGKSYSSVCVDNNQLYTTGNTGEKDVLTCLDRDGKKLWETVYGDAWTRNFDGTRSTPTICDKKLYLLSGAGELVCMDKKTGDILWSENTFEEFGGEHSTFGICESPLVDEDMVFVTPGGETTTMVAYNRHNGEVIWKSESVGEKTQYVSPLMIEVEGRKQIVTLTLEHVIGVNPSNGTIDWKVNYLEQGDFERRPRMNHANTPLYREGELFVCAGYDFPGMMLTLSDKGKSAKVKWINPNIDTHHGGVIVLDNAIYGSNHLNNANGNWLCIDWETGETLWEEKWYNKGSIISADNKIFCYEEKGGHLGLFVPNKSKMTKISEFVVPKGEGPHWNHPTISDGKLYVRHGEALMVYEIGE